MSNILIVHAHHEPKSFSSALAQTAKEVLTRQGHEVVFSDLYAMKFDPVSDRRNFRSVANPDYLKQQVEETYATNHNGFAADLETEMRKIEACDLLIFSFPLWWFSMPAILKGWVDRVFAYDRFYGAGRWYDTGHFQGKRAMVLMTTGSDEEKYSGRGPHASLEVLLAPIHHGIFRFNGFSPLSPFVAWSAAHGTDSDRGLVIEAWKQRLKNLLTETALPNPAAEL
ncbi:NAD(P)H-dependent oxidoreductase [Luteolibacter pohnpeiensis]|uniref:NAD(P)H-dependent oxidoreductase n=1 Tax=Luteolibacter pohnpeiensis TaxID=454153 RepID=A0A934VXV9_9BACT|nr:NAD(P)H-dependent oxidoreductase [Luteolibacter pohnpeiensis]MBK1883894.1 NAD(P)H-dependent oxidoreductase [Luteolibacter pohnpeiensis]